MTDAHVHFRDWNQSAKETVLHGMLTGAASGFDVFFDMPNCNPPVTDRETALRRLELGKQAEEELKKRGKNYEFHRYDGAGHGIWYYDKPMYRQEQAMDSFNKTITFFDKYLK